MSLLEIENLGVRFLAEDGDIDAVHSASLEIEKGETVALVGESGSGKSVTALSVLQLLPYPRATHPRGSVRFGGEELLGAKTDRLRALRGGRISMIFQEPMTSLNPLHSIEKQISETLILHRRLDKAQARTRTVELLKQVGLPNVEERLDAWPHQLSGGQRQRVMIAMALANEPDLLIADEPTTALDVTVQAQILQLLKDLQQQLGMAVLLITHDLGIVRHMADRVYVMKDGNVVEHNAMRALFSDPQHDYTKLLINAEPSGNPPAIDQRAPLVIETRELKVHFPILRGLLRTPKAKLVEKRVIHKVATAGAAAEPPRQPVPDVVATAPRPPAARAASAAVGAWPVASAAGRPPSLLSATSLQPPCEGASLALRWLLDPSTNPQPTHSQPTANPQQTHTQNHNRRSPRIDR